MLQKTKIIIVPKDTTDADDQKGLTYLMVNGIKNIIGRESNPVILKANTWYTIELFTPNSSKYNATTKYSALSQSGGGFNLKNHSSNLTYQFKNIYSYIK